MAQRHGFKNIQIQSKPELYETFEDLFTQSGANSKAEFLSWMIDKYLLPEESSSPSLKKIEESLINAIKEKDELIARLELYETEGMKEILNRHKGEKLTFKNSGGQKMTIEINDLPDVFSAIYNSVKIS